MLPIPPQQSVTVPTTMKIVLEAAKEREEADNAITADADANRNFCSRNGRQTSWAAPKQMNEVAIHSSSGSPSSTSHLDLEDNHEQCVLDSAEPNSTSLSFDNARWHNLIACISNAEVSTASPLVTVHSISGLM